MGEGKEDMVAAVRITLLTKELAGATELTSVSQLLLLLSSAFSRKLVRSSNFVFSDSNSLMTPSSSSTLVFSSTNLVFWRSLNRRWAYKR